MGKGGFLTDLRDNVGHVRCVSSFRAVFFSGVERGVGGFFESGDFRLLFCGFFWAGREVLWTLFAVEGVGPRREGEIGCSQEGEGWESYSGVDLSKSFLG